MNLKVFAAVSAISDFVMSHMPNNIKIMILIEDEKAMLKKLGVGDQELKNLIEDLKAKAYQHPYDTGGSIIIGLENYRRERLSELIRSLEARLNDDSFQDEWEEISRELIKRELEYIRI